MGSNSLVMYRSRAPVRIDFAGGWTDVAEFCLDTPGKVVNAAINIYSYASLVPGAANDEKGVRIYSSDYDSYVEAEDVRKLEYDGNIDLVKGAIRRMNVAGGFEIATQSHAPAGSGLGTSAAMGVALIGALSQYAGTNLLGYEVAEMASEIERRELGIRGGKQDHYSSAIGGISFMEFRGEEVRYSRIDLPRSTVLELQKNLVLCYTGRSRLSGDVHRSVFENFEKGEGETVSAMAELKTIAVELKNALMQGDLDGYAELLDENWRNQQRLHPSVTNDNIDELFSIARREGARGGKALGAGGGGCLLFYCRADREPQVAKALAEAGAQVIRFQFVFDGLEGWKSTG